MKTINVLINNFKNCLYLDLDEKLKGNLIEDWKNHKLNVSERVENRFKTTALAKTSLNTLDLRREVEFEPIKEVERRSKMSIEERSNLSNRELLNFDREERLEFVTNPIVDYPDVVSWKVKDIKFYFDQRQNKDLFIKTTAWQVLPPNVREVKIGWEVYSRISLNWEFFNENNERLIIKDWTKIEVVENESKENIAEIESKNEETSKNFIKTNPQFESFSDLVKLSIDKWIDPNFAIMVFWDKLKSITDPILRKSEIEDMLAEFDRVRWIVWCSDKKGDDKLYDKDLSLSLIIKFNPNNWKNIAKIYWLKEDYIKQKSSEWIESFNIEETKIENEDSLPNWNFLKWEALINDVNFLKKLELVCSHIWANREDLIKLMKAESWINPRIVNSIWATWLIQFMPKTAIWLWTTVWKLRLMSWVQQLDYVEKYFKENSRWHNLSNITELYKVVFFPASLWKPNSWLFQANWISSNKLASQNPIISKHSTRSDWLIDWYCFSRYVNNHVTSL